MQRELANEYTRSNIERLQNEYPQFRLIHVCSYPKLKTVEYEEMMTLATLEMFEACRDLSSSGFKMYIYLLSKDNNSIFPLIRKEVCEDTGISTHSYRNAIKELIDEGYLQKDTQGIFHMYPRSIVPFDDYLD